MLINIIQPKNITVVLYPVLIVNQKTQDLEEIQTFVYSLMMWKRATFVNKYKKDKNAILCGKKYFYPVKNLSTIIIKNSDDLKLADYIMKSKSRKFTLKYDRIIKLKKFL